MQSHLTSLGSSFAAGPGLQPLSNREAMRSTVNYSSIVARELGATHDDFTVSGSTLLNIISQPQKIFGVQFPLQISGISEKTDFVTLTAGGNDFGYTGGIIVDEFKCSAIGRLSAYLFPSRFEINSITEKELVDRFISVVDNIHLKAPSARILLVEYLTVFGPDTKSGIDVWMSAESIKHHQEVAASLNRAYAKTAELRDFVELVPVAQASTDHSIGSKEPWVDAWNTQSLLRKRSPFHPNERGMQAVAKIILEQIREISER